jgi:Rrf2 family iron-sulfur cluster assembly transcriptional regulator
VGGLTPCSSKNAEGLFLAQSDCGRVARSGIIDATRGNGGGYRLKRHAAEVRLFEIVVLFDRDRTGVTCVLGGGKECDHDNPCPAHDAWRGVRTAYLDFLNTTTLADISQLRRPNVVLGQ